MTGTPQPISHITPESANHNRGRIEERLAKYATKPVGKLGDAPEWMSPEEKEIWVKLAASSPSELGESDRTLFEIAVTLKFKLETHDIRTAELGVLANALKSLGYVPTDRKGIAPPKADDPLDRFNE